MNPTSELLWDGRRNAPWTLILAHGAGQGMRSEFMQWFAGALALADFRVGRFEFPYMQATTADGRRRPPNPAQRLLESWRQCIQAAEQAGAARERLVIGGKSLGGRMASLVADAERVAGLVCLGYPFHPPGKPERTRTAHLEGLRTPTLICQGERDPFGGKAEVADYRLSPAIRLCWLPDGDHGFTPRKASGLTPCANRERALDAITHFLADL